MTKEPGSVSTPDASVDRDTHAPSRLRRVYRFVRGLLALAMAIQILLVLVILFTPAVETVHDWLDVSQDPPDPADVMVCLGGHDRRIIWTAELYHRGIAPQVVASSNGGAAERIRNILVKLDVPPDRIVVDRLAKTTADHPDGVAAMLGPEVKQQRVLLVTSTNHSRRALACFRAAGYRNVAVYAEHRKGPPEELPLGQLCRNRIMGVRDIAYSCAALLLYWIEGKI